MVRKVLNNDQKLTWAKTKTREMIIINVVGPFIIENIVKELRSAECITIQGDDSNPQAMQLVLTVNFCRYKKLNIRIFKFARRNVQFNSWKHN